jgi:uncharacterized protein YdeI (YjbR/CyaY-like superfamily)
MTPTFFSTPADFGSWLERHHADASELLVGFYKRGSGQPSITWPESVDEALCFGWIDGVRKRIDDDSYTIRFTPRKPRSTWSAVNLKRAEELTRADRMRPAGLRSFEQRAPDRSGTYSYEQRHEAKLDAAQQRQLRANKQAWAFFQSQPPWYRRTAIFWVLNAKKEETRSKRLATLIEDSAAGRTVKPLMRPSR